MTEINGTWDGECDECHQWAEDLVQFPTASVHICEACLSEAKYEAERCGR